MKFFIVLSVVALASCSPVAQDESVFRLFLGNIVNCLNSDLSLCLKEQALKATERLGTARQLKLTEGITIINNGPKEARSLDLSSETEERKKQVTERLWENTSDLMKNSDIELSFNTPEDDDESRALGEEGRGKKKEMKKKIKMLVPLLLLAKAKAVALVVLSLLVIAASLFKLAVLAKIAFIAKLIHILKALIAKKHEEEHHGWVPHHEEHGHGWEGGWSRSRNEGNNLAYAAYAN